MSDLSYADLANHPAEYHVHKGEALFPRIDVKKEIEYLGSRGCQAEGCCRSRRCPQGRGEEEAVAEITDHEPEISFDDFCKETCRRKRAGT